MSFVEQIEDVQEFHRIECKIGFALGLVLLGMTLFFDAPGGMSETAWKCLGMGTMMAAWWATEAIPIPATSLLPILLIPLLGLGKVATAAAPYANPTIYLFLGGFILGLAMEKWNLHKRIALGILRVVGASPSAQIAGFMVATAFISMWVSNTATAIMMLPIGLSVINLVTLGGNDSEHQRFAAALLLAIAYAASLGGVATLIGTPPNALLAAYLQEHYKIHVGFGQWMVIGIPTAVVMLFFTWWWLTRKKFHFVSPEADVLIQEEYTKLGPMSRGEILVAIVFVCAATAWVLQPFIAQIFPQVNDTIIAVATALALFVIPVNPRYGVFLMDWETANRLPWGILLLFGGGLSLAGVIGSSGLAAWLAGHLSGLAGMGTLFIIGLVVAVIIFLTELTSNTATAAAFLPLLGALAVSQGLPPELFCVPAAVAASCAFMMPVATPPNAIVFASGKMKIQTMISAGFMLNIFGIFAVTVISYYLVGILWPAP